jgi:hypothetical protein
VSVPDRGSPVLACTLYPTVPLPVPLDPAVMPIHATLLVAVQPQPPAAVTSTVPVPPFAGTFWLDVDSEYEHPDPCCTVNV